jgi:hypothetical protein
MTPTPKNYAPLIIICVTFLATEAAFIGGWLLWKGFAGGGEMIITLNTAIAGLLGFLGGRSSAHAFPKVSIDATPTVINNAGETGAQS